MKISKKISDDYQKILRELVKREQVEDLEEEGKKWTMGTLLTWSGPMVEAGLIEYEQIRKITDAMNEKTEDENFFGWAHGNIIGDHIIIVEDEFYLLDLAIKPRIGNGYYDWLRALDFVLLKTNKTEEFVQKIPEWLDKFFPKVDRRELNLVLVNRLIGILGWDILYHKTKATGDDLTKKKQIILEMIKQYVEHI